MAKDRKKLQHIHSSIPDKQPTAASLEVGEIAVNNAKDQEFLSIKNSDNKVVRLSSDEQIVTIMEKKEVTPYKGYVRGETGPSSTAGDAPTADSYGSYGITENDLLTNKSNIIVKINQVAAGNTVKHDKINGAKDRYNKLVNPTSDSGITDGAGFYIDMSRYAMQDANPQFSSTTNTCRTTLNGTTIIRGLGGTCGSLLDIKVNSAKTDIETANTEITSAATIIGTNSTTISGNTTLVISGTTTETKIGNVTENNLSNKTENTNGNLAISTVGTTNISSNDNVCVSSQKNADFYGKNNTNVGIACDGSVTSTATVKSTDIVNVYSPTINESGVTNNNTFTTVNTTATTVNQSGNAYNVTATTNINGNTNITGNTVNNGNLTVTDKIYFTPDCTDKLTATTVNAAVCEVFDRSVITIEENHNPTDESLAAVYTFYQNGETVKDASGNTVQIEVVKDKVLKSAVVVQNTSGEWVIRLTWITYDPDTQTSTETTTDVPASELVKDIDFVNSDAIKGSIWYDSTSGNQKISADTTVQIVTDGNGTKTFSKSNAVHSLNSYKLTTAAGEFTPKEFDPLKESVTINVPTCVNHLNRHKITFQSGSTASFNNQTYDPGKACDNSAETINIPTSLTHLQEWDGSCLTVPGCAKATNFYQTSDRNAKENIATPDFGKLVKANNAHVMKFNFKDDPNHVDTYGVIAQDIEELGLNEIVMTDETGRKSVDYTSLMMLKIAYLENENKRLRSMFSDISTRLNKLENKD